MHSVFQSYFILWYHYIVIIVSMFALINIIC